MACPSLRPYLRSSPTAPAAPSHALLRPSVPLLLDTPCSDQDRTLNHSRSFLHRSRSNLRRGRSAQQEYVTSGDSKKDAFSHRAGGIAEASEPGRRDGDVQKIGHVLYGTTADGALSGGGGQAGQVRSVCDTSWIVYSFACSYSYRKSMRRPYQTSLQYKIQRGILAIRPSSVRFVPTS